MDEPQNINPQFFYAKRLPPQGVAVWVRHLLLLVLTLCTTTVAGVLLPFGPLDLLPASDPQTAAELWSFFVSLPSFYVHLVGQAVYLLSTNGYLLQYGLKFSLSLLFILTAHEMGHYIACRIYKVDSTLPFFLPTPPMIGPAGTFGAFIKIRSPIPTRRAIFDIGVAGPIAGFLALVPIAIIGVLELHSPIQGGMPADHGGISFGAPLFLRGIGYVAGVTIDGSYTNPYYFAAWVGLLVTALNLIPSGQLDGGHAVYAALGERVHYWTGRIAFPVMAILSILGMIFYSSPSGFLVAIILAVMMRVKHPEPLDRTPLDGKRKLIAVLALVIFVLSFLPFPVRVL